MPGIANHVASENYDPDPNLKIWLSGELVAATDAKVNVFDHGLRRSGKSLRNSC